MVDKLGLSKVILKSLSLQNKIEVLKERWRYIRPEDVPKCKARGYVVERGPKARNQSRYRQPIL